MPAAPPGPLGEFEVIVLLAVLHLTERGEPAYGSPIRHEIERRGGRSVARGAVYITLDRLAEKGLLDSKLSAGSAERKLRPRRLFRVTPSGLRALRQSMSLLTRMQRGLEPVLGDL
jgi:PadR family transcriptional regulator